MQYTGIKAASLSGAVEKRLGQICVKWCTSDKKWATFFTVRRKLRVVKVCECYGLKKQPSTKGSAHLVRSNRAMRHFTAELQWSHYWSRANRIYIDGTAQTDTEVGVCDQENKGRSRVLGRKCVSYNLRCLMFMVSPIRTILMVQN